MSQEPGISKGGLRALVLLGSVAAYTVFNVFSDYSSQRHQDRAVAALERQCAGGEINNMGLAERLDSDTSPIRLCLEGRMYTLQPYTSDDARVYAFKSVLGPTGTAASIPEWMGPAS
jgi:hypothetical protein